MKKRNISYTVKNELCLGCGICADVCPTKSITMHIVKGEWRPQIKESYCLNKNGCNKCYMVCSGVGLEIKKYADELYLDSACSDKYIGKYEKLYTGWSCDMETRRSANSGGLISSVLIYLLQNKYIDGAVVTRYSEEDPMRPQAFIATTPEDILKSKGSKYAPVQLSDTLRQAIREGQRLVVVGLPCHIQSIRKWAKIDKKLDKVIFAYFSVYCSSERTFYAQEYLCRYFGVAKTDIKYFSFRERGRLKLVGNDGNDIFAAKGIESPPYYKYYRLIGSHFKPNRCQMCVDHYGMLADVSFGDIGIAPYTQDKIGINSLIVRNNNFVKILDKAIEDSAIELFPLNPDLLNKSQKDMMYYRLKRAKAKHFLNKLLGKETAKYDLLFHVKTDFYNILKIIVVDIKRFIGKRKYLWFLIDIENKKKKL